MNNLTRKQFDNLVTHRADPAISIYMPTDRAGGARANNRSLEILLARAEDALVARNIRPAEARQRLEGIRNAIADPDFWQQLSDGLALFIDDDESRCYHLPTVFPELVVVGNRFQTTPLLPSVCNDGEFYLLAVSQKQVRAFAGSRWEMAELETRGMPTNLDDALKYDQPEEVRQFHSARPGTHTSRDATFHGQGGAPDEKKNELMAFFQVLDRQLKSRLTDSRRPLVVACVDYLFPLYERVNSYPNLQHAHVSGNSDRLSASQLHELAWSIVERSFGQDAKNAVGQIAPLAEVGKATCDLLQVVPLASEGAIDTLLLDCQSQQWGIFDTEHNIVHLHDRQSKTNDELLNLTMALVIANHGKVFSVSADELPQHSPIAALLRYPKENLKALAVAGRSIRT